MIQRLAAAPHDLRASPTLMPEGGSPSTSAINTVRSGPRGASPVVLVHPVGLDLTYWSAQIEALVDYQDVVAFDLPGHGRTPGDPSDWTIENAVALLGEVIRSTGAPSAHVVGLSVGGMIAQALAIARPEIVRSLVLIDTAAAFSEDARMAMRARAAAARAGGMRAILPATLERWFTARTVTRRPDLIERVTRTLLADDPLVHAAVWDMIGALDLIPDLQRISCRTLVLVGEHDQSTPLSSATVLRSRIPDAEMHVIPGTSHMAALENPDGVNHRMVSFLSDVQQVSASASGSDQGESNKRGNDRNPV